MLSTATWEFNKALKALAKLTDVSNFALGDTFTFADILLAHTINWADKFEFDVPKEYLGYRDRMYAREGACNAIAELT